MKKQKKLIVVLSAAAILSASASMTSLADSGWVEEQGGWVYYGENGERVTEKWIKSGDSWFWLESDGQMATKKLLTINNNYYYLDEDGARVDSQWVSFDNEDAGQEDEPKQHWYYFQSDGKACKRSDSVSSSAICAKDIDGKKYTFDTEGRMLYGWVSDGERQTSEDAWQTCDYYFGTENDGIMRDGWEQMTITADEEGKIQPGNTFWDDEQDRWFYFSSSGKKTKGDKDDYIQKTITGNKYGFDEYGRMIASWYADPTIITTDLAKGKEFFDSATAQGGSNYTKEFMYFGSPESGAEFANGWFKAVPSLYLMAEKHKEDSPNTYYADGNGHLYANALKSIDGIRYGFDNYGRLMSGFVCLNMSEPDSSSSFDTKHSSDDRYDPFSNEDEFDETVARLASDFSSHKRRFYLFYGPNNSMLTGKRKVKLGDEEFEFMFETDGYLKGSGVVGKKDGKLYMAGKLLKPETGEKYAIFKQDFDNHGLITKVSVEDFIENNCEYGFYDEKKDETVWKAMESPTNVIYYLVNSSGAIVKNKLRAKNVDNYEITVKNNKIQSIVAEE